MSAPKIWSAYRDVSAFFSDAAKLAKMAYNHASCRIVVVDRVDVKCITLWLQEHTNINNGASLILRRPDNDTSEMCFYPGDSPFFFFFQKTLMSVDFKKTSGESVAISCLGKSNQPIKNLLEQVRQEYTWVGNSNNAIFTHTNYGTWKDKRYVPRREPCSVILADGLEESIIEDVSRFLAAKDQYISRGIPYRRGYLFYGPPGTGKTSMAIVIASVFRLPIYMIQLEGINDRELGDLMQSVGSRSLILVEDIDRATENKQSSRVSMSGLLNVIDGVMAPEGNILVMTTNHREALDSALIRPGRIDVECELSFLTKEQARRMCLKFHPGEEDKADQFANLAVEKEMTPATAQGVLLQESLTH